jgi:hypothetical protein
MRLARHVARIEKMENAYKMLVGRPEVKTLGLSGLDGR